MSGAGVETSDLEILVENAERDAKIELRLWLRLLSTANLINQELRRRLREEYAMTLPKFDLLAQLDREADGLRLGELSRRMMVTNGNVTGLVDRLVEEGYITRKVASEDRRAAVVTLTVLGTRTFAEIAATHERWLTELLSDAEPAILRRLTAELGLVKASVSAHAAGGGKA